MSKHVFVLGAAGFIGRHLTEALAQSGHHVIAGTRRPVTFAHPDIENVIAPFDEPSHFAPLVARCGRIVHAASLSTPSSSASQPQLDGNLRTTIALIETLQHYPDRHLVYLSSGGTLYGDCAATASEREPLRPRSYHGAGKAAAELFIHAWAEQFDGAATLLRPSNVYGPGQQRRKGFGVVPTAFDATLQAHPFIIWGDGSAVRDYLYITDLVELCKSIVAVPMTRGAQIFNVSSGLGTSLDELLSQIELVTGIPITRIYQPARRVDIKQIVPDNSSVRSAYGWDPGMHLDEGLRRTWEWFKATHH